MKFEVEGKEFAKILRSLEQFVQKSERSGQLLVQNVLLTCSWRILRSQKIEQLYVIHYSDWKKILGFRNLQEKLEN